MNNQSDIFKHYPGGKNVNGTYHKIINLIPPHNTYIEPFLGGGAILRNKRSAAHTVGNDIDPDVFRQWQSFQMDGFTLHNEDALQLLLAFMVDDRNTFVYLDPPYPFDARKTQTDIYDHESTDDLHERLLAMAVKATFNCMISTYPNKLYAEKLKDWECYEYKSITRGGNATELLYMNYPQPTELHDYQHLGKDCWDRQRIKRKIKRRIDTLAKLPILEQQAIMQGLSAGQSKTSVTDPKHN